jgi:hypothetical protein
LDPRGPTKTVRSKSCRLAANCDCRVRRWTAPEHLDRIAESIIGDLSQGFYRARHSGVRKVKNELATTLRPLDTKRNREASFISLEVEPAMPGLRVLVLD